jgi:hypothetical protein
MGFLKNLFGERDSSKQPAPLTPEEERRRAEEKGRAHAEATGATFHTKEEAAAGLKLLKSIEKLESSQRAKEEKIRKEKSKYQKDFSMRTTPLTREEIKELDRYEILCCIVVKSENIVNLSKSRREEIFVEIFGRGLKALQDQSQELCDFLQQRVDNVEAMRVVPIFFDEDDMIDGVRYVGNANACFYSDDDYSDDYFAKNIYNKYLFDVSSEVNAEFKSPFAMSVFINFHSPS